MTAIAALLERPLWELAFGATALGAVCVVSTLAFFWIGFRITEVPAVDGFEGMFGLAEPLPEGNAQALRAEVDARLKAIQDRGTAAAHRNSLDELAVAMRSRESDPAASARARNAIKEAGADRRA